jgi:hypothetical protein
LLSGLSPVNSFSIYACIIIVEAVAAATQFYYTPSKEGPAVIANPGTTCSFNQSFVATGRPSEPPGTARREKMEKVCVAI